MVYAAPRHTPLSTARDRQRDGMPAYQAALDTMPPRHAAAVREYVAAVHAEAAARRIETNRLQAAINPRNSGNHHKNGA